MPSNLFAGRVRVRRSLVAVVLILVVLWSASAARAQEGTSGTYVGTLETTHTYLAADERDERTTVLTCEADVCTVVLRMFRGGGPALTDIPMSGGTGSVEFESSYANIGDEDCIVDYPADTLTLTLEGDTMTLVYDQPKWEGQGVGSAIGCVGGGINSTFVGTLQTPTTTASSQDDPEADPSESGAAAEDEASAGEGSGDDLEPSLVAKLSPRQVASLAAVARGDRSIVTASVATPSEAAEGGGRTVVNLVLAGLAVLLLVFPSELFNSTWSEHHGRVEAFAKRLIPGRRQALADVQPGAPRSETVLWVGTVAVGAVVAGFLDPTFGLDRLSATLVFGALVAFAVGALISGFAAVRYRRARRLPADAVIDAVPSGLVVAVLCVVVSRAVGFRPGYLFGLVGGLAFLAALDRREAGRSEMTATIATFVAAMGAWVVAGPVGTLANEADPSVAVQVLDMVVAALFIGGIEGLLFGLVPLQVLPGHTLYTWSRGVWAVTTFVVVFVFLQVLLRPEAGYLGTSATASAIVTYGLFVGFGLVSILFWGYFRLRPDPPVAEGQPEAEVASGI